MITLHVNITNTATVKMITEWEGGDNQELITEII